MPTCLLPQRAAINETTLQKLTYQFEYKLKAYFGAPQKPLTMAQYTCIFNLKEIIKNAIDAGARQLLIGQAAQRDNPEQLNSDTVFVLDNGRGFGKNFTQNSPFRDYSELLETEGNGQTIASEKDKKTSLGGHGQGLAQASTFLAKHGGRLQIGNRTDPHANSGAVLIFRSNSATFDFETAKVLWGQNQSQYDSQFVLDDEELEAFSESALSPHSPAYRMIQELMGDSEDSNATRCSSPAFFSSSLTPRTAGIDSQQASPLVNYYSP